MDVERKNKKVNISVPIELLERIDEYADENYISRTAVFCMATNQYLVAAEMQKMFKELTKVFKRLQTSDEIDDDLRDKLDELEDVCTVLSGQYVLPSSFDSSDKE